MARTTKRGTCELCGASANVGMNHGAKVCPQCTHVQSALNKRIESVAAAARSMGKTEELLGHLIPAGGGIAVKVTADLLQEISGIVGYQGEDPGELVAAVRRRVLTCASCDSEDVLHEIREIVGYSPDMGDNGLADAVRAFADRRPADDPDCAECDAANALIEIAELVGKRGASSGLVVEAVRVAASSFPACSACFGLRDDLLCACGLLQLGDEGEVGWDVAAAAAIQTIAELVNHCGDLLRQLTRERADNALMHIEIGRLNGQTHSESEEMTALRDDLLRACGLEMDDTEDGEGWDVAAAAAIQEIAELTNRRDDLVGLLTKERADNARLRNEIAKRNNVIGVGETQIDILRAELTLAEQSRDEWEQRAVQAESNVETLEAELRSKEDEAKEFMHWANGKIGEMRVPDQLLFDLASIAVSAGGNVTHMALGKLIDAARRAA